MPDQTPGHQTPITFERDPTRYRHWRLGCDGPVATVSMAVDPGGGLRDGHELKLNSYDLGVDIELADIVQRLRFEHPEVQAVVLTSALDRVFCAGANIQMLAGSTHDHKVNFCKFTNETRNSIEDAARSSGQYWLAAINGSAAGGGYELALACAEILLVDDRSSTVSLPEVPLLGVLPGTGGLTRLVDKRHVRRDLADVFATRAEGVGGQQAVDWGLVDGIAARSVFAEEAARRARALAGRSNRPGGAGGVDPAAAPDSPGGTGVRLGRLQRDASAAGIGYSTVEVSYDRDLSAATILVTGPDGTEPGRGLASGADWWPLRACRELDDAILHLRFNEPELGTWILKTEGDPAHVCAIERALDDEEAHWLAREIRAYWARTMRRLDVSARTLVAVVEPGSCFAGTLAELALAADRSFMLEGQLADSDLPAPVLHLNRTNDGHLPMPNGLSRLATRFWGHPDRLDAARALFGKDLLAADCLAAGLVTFAPDDIDWDDEIRLMLEERAAFSPDALTGMEASLRFPGPETTDTKIFGRLSAWQNWIFVRPNASGEAGALRRYGTGSRPVYDRRRV
jgi:benzoyl-CoA-dihydrodiol lyase